MCCLPYCGSQLSVTITNCPKEATYEEEKFISAHSFGGVNSTLAP